MAFVPSKLRPPVLRGERLSRPKLIAMLDRGLDHRVTLVCAPAGFGKTWLVADWLTYHSDIAQVWLSLDTRDNDPARLWLHLAEGVGREIPETGLSGRSSGDGPLDVDWLVDTVIAGLEAYGDQVLIVLDDIHLIEDATATASLDRLLAEIPPSSRLVLLGRHDPMMRLARWRASGGLAEIRADDLRLTVDEVAEMVSASLGSEIPPGSVQQLHSRLSGWIAGLRLVLAGTALVEGPEAPFERILAAPSSMVDLLTEEVLAVAEPGLGEFLMETSLPNELSGDLCDALTGGSGGAEILARLARDGLFTVERGDNGGWYRYHDLFREVLRLQLGKVHPESVPDLHRRAAIWLHDHGRILDAIHHALASGAPELAGGWLVAASVDLLRTGQVLTLVRLAVEIDEALEEPSLALLGTLAYALFITGSTNGVLLSELTVRILEIAARRGVDGDEEGWEWPGFPFGFDGRDDFIAIFEGGNARWSGDPERVLGYSHLVPTRFGTFEAAMAEVLVWLERYREAGPLVARYSNLGTPVHGDAISTAIKGLGLAAMVALGEGRLGEAEELSKRASDLNAERPGGPSVQGAYAGLAHAHTAWERGSLPRASSLLKTAVDLAVRQDEMATYVLGQILSSRIKWSQGDWTEASADLERAPVMPFGRVASDFFAELVALERARQALLTGDVGMAETAVPDWRRRLAEGPVSMREQMLLTRFVIAVDEDPSRLLKRLPEGVEATLPDRIQLRLLKALAACNEGHEKEALEALTAAMRLAAASGHRQRFLDERHTLGVLLDNAAARAGIILPPPDHDPFNDDLNAHDRSDAVQAIDLVEPLTVRELEVLAFLPSHRSYRQIGDELGLSTNTIKYHVKGIYRKLEADGRSAAIRTARDSGLIR